MEIKLTRDEVLAHAARFQKAKDKPLGESLRSATERGYMFKRDLLEVAKWKWSGGRTRQLVELNDDEEVEIITAAAFSTASERLKIGALLSLSGVRWPMASTILHFAFPNNYPILDVRAMRTVGGTTIYNFERWWLYTLACRSAAIRLGVTMRELDLGLWGADLLSNQAKDRT